MIKSMFKICSLGLMLMAINVQAQNTPRANNDQNQVIDLGAKEVKIKIETPQVQIISQRIKPEFDDIKIDRSFRKELIGEDEKINLKPRSDFAEYNRIDIEQLMKKLR